MRRIAGIHLQQRVLRPRLVLYIVERVGHLTYIVIQSAGAHQQRVGTDSLGCFRRKVRHLHRMLEGAGSTLCKHVKQFGVDVRQFDKRDGRDETEQFLKHINQTVASYREQAADEEIEIHPQIDRRPYARLRESECGISHTLREEYPCRRLYELCAAGHVRQRRHRHHAYHDLDKEELYGRRHYDRRNEYRCEMQEKGCSRIKEDTGQDGHPRKGNQINRQIEPQSEASQRDNNKHLQAEEQNRRGAAQISGTEDIEIDDKQTQEQHHQHRFPEDRECALAVTERLILIGAPQRLQNLVIAFCNDLAFVYDLLSFLHKPLRRRNSGQQFGSHVLCLRRIQHQVLSTVIAEFLMRGHRCIDLRQGIPGLVDCYSGITLRLHPFHRFERHHFHFPLHARKIFEIRGFWSVCSCASVL